MSQSDLAINGKDLIEHGFLPGKSLGDLLNSLLKEVLVHPEYNDKEKLLCLSEKYRDTSSF